MTLRERIEREMREAHYKDAPNCHCGFVWLKPAVAVAERLVRGVDGMAQARLVALRTANERAEAAERRESNLREAIKMAANVTALIEKQRDEARKALAEARGKWGHVMACKCCIAIGDTLTDYEYDDAELPLFCTEESHKHPYRDPRCAPERGGGE